MRKMLFILGLLLSVLNIINGIPTFDTVEGAKKDNRSISSAPTIELNDNLLWVHTSQPLENCEVQLYNEKGIIIYKDTISIFPTESHCIILDNYQHGIYLLLLNHIGIPSTTYTLSL